MPRPHPLSPLAALLAAMLAVLPACDGCHGSKPYTPYTLSDPPAASGAASAALAAGDAGAPDGGPAFPRVAADKAPGDGTRWPFEGGAAEPPAGHAFAEGLVLDADGDGKPDLVAWSRAPDGLRGEVWFAPGKDPANGRTLAALPGDLAAPGCAIEASLSRIGPAVLVFDYDPRCTGRQQGKGAHWIAVFRLVPGAPPELGLELRIASPADGEAIAVALDGRDRDGDGRGDVTATLTLTGAPRPFPAGAGGEARATLAYFDRPAGLSRDPSEPEASLKAAAAALIADGRKKTTAPHVAAAANAARRLHALLCEEAGKPAVTTTAGPVRCGDVRLLEDAAMAETEAALNLGDPLAAAAAMARLDGHRKDLDALFAKHVPSIPGRLARTTAATPDVTPSPSFGPLVFDKNGDLLVRTRERMIRVDHASFAESAEGAVAPWSARLSFSFGATGGGADGGAPAPAGAPAWTLVSIEERCDAPTLLARFEARFDSGPSTFETPLPILTPARCTSGRVPAEILGPTRQGDLLSIRGDLVTIPLDSPPVAALADTLALAPGFPSLLGAGRSPDGTVLALTTARGILVAQIKGQGRASAAKLWTTPSLDNATACVPNDAADRIACAVKSAVAIYDAK